MTATIIAVFVISTLSLAVPLTAAATDTSKWTLQVLAPTPNQVVTTPVLPIKVVAHGYTSNSRYAGMPDNPTLGHYHEILDGRLIDLAPTTDPTRDTISLVGVIPGPHILTLVPARNDHSNIWGSAVNVPFIYAGPFLPQPGPFTFNNPPSIVITSPATSNTVRGDSFIMAVDVQNFVISGPSYGKELKDGVGHWHIFVDMPMMSKMLTMANQNSQQVYIRGIAPGVHTFYAVLVNNQHMPFMVLDPATNTMVLASGTFDTVTLNVQN